jgi:hypothetical protein
METISLDSLDGLSSLDSLALAVLKESQHFQNVVSLGRD